MSRFKHSAFLQSRNCNSEEIKIVLTELVLSDIITSSDVIETFELFFLDKKIIKKIALSADDRRADVCEKLKLYNVDKCIVSEVDGVMSSFDMYLVNLALIKYFHQFGITYINQDSNFEMDELKRELVNSGSKFIRIDNCVDVLDSSMQEFNRLEFKADYQDEKVNVLVGHKKMVYEPL